MGLPEALVTFGNSDNEESSPAEAARPRKAPDWRRRLPASVCHLAAVAFVSYAGQLWEVSSVLI